MRDTHLPKLRWLRDTHGWHPIDGNVDCHLNTDKAINWNPHTEGYLWLENPSQSISRPKSPLRPGVEPDQTRPATQAHALRN